MYSKSCGDFVAAAGAVCLAVVGAAAAPVGLAVGRPGEVLRSTVAAPNLATTTSAGAWLPTTGPSSLPQQATPAVGPVVPPSAVGTLYPHVTEPPGAAAPTVPPAALDFVVGGSGQGVATTVIGAGGGQWVAGADGVVGIEPCLRTRAGARLVVRLYEADGTEVTFDGRPYMDWDRPDDVTRALLVVRGVPDERSMIREGQGDWSPQPGLRYQVAVRQGQRLTVQVTGEPESDSSVTVAVTGSATGGPD